MCYSVGDKVRLVTNTLFVTKGQEGTVIEPMKGQTPPQLFPNRVSFPIGQDTRTVWCGTDELELVVDDAGPTTDDSVADGSRDYSFRSGLEVRDPIDTAPTDDTCTHGPLCYCTHKCRSGCAPDAHLASLDPCPCLIGGPCEAFNCGNIDYANNPDLDGHLAERYGDEQEGPWSEDWEWDGLSQFEEAVVGVFVDAQELLFKKHKDYGPKNISQSPGGPLNGLRVRMHDKLARLNHLVDAGQEPQVLDEKLTDTLLDLANYAIISVLVLKGEWPSE